MECSLLKQLVIDLNKGKNYAVYHHELTEVDREQIIRIINDNFDEYLDDSYNCIDAVLEDAYETMENGNDWSLMFPNGEDDDS